MLMMLVAAIWSCAATESPAQKLSRGKYLVEDVAGCAHCHSPRNEKGEYDQAHWLQGSPLSVAPIVPMPAWANTAPMIAGLPSLSEQDAVKFLEGGTLPGGRQPRPPMPQYKYSHDDAGAVVLYLKSLAPKKN